MTNKYKILVVLLYVVNTRVTKYSNSSRFTKVLLMDI